MADGPGAYDDECTTARESADADVCLLMVIGGNRGSGFSVQAHEEYGEQAIARSLRKIADALDPL